MPLLPLPLTSELKGSARSSRRPVAVIVVSCTLSIPSASGSPARRSLGNSRSRLEYRPRRHRYQRHSSARRVDGYPAVLNLEHLDDGNTGAAVRAVQKRGVPARSRLSMSTASFGPVATHGSESARPRDASHGCRWSRAVHPAAASAAGRIGEHGVDAERGEAWASRDDHQLWLVAADDEADHHVVARTDVPRVAMSSRNGCVEFEDLDDGNACRTPNTGHDRVHCW